MGDEAGGPCRGPKVFALGNGASFFPLGNGAMPAAHGVSEAPRRAWKAPLEPGVMLRVRLDWARPLLQGCALGSEVSLLL